MIQTDFCNQPGALRLKAMLISYWTEQTGDGSSIRVFPVPQCVRRDGTKEAHSHRFDLRSDMVNGTPRGFVWRFDQKQRKWGLVRERTGAEQVSQSVVGEADASAAQGAYGEVSRRAPGARDRAAEKVGHLRRRIALRAV